MCCSTVTLRWLLRCCLWLVDFVDLHVPRLRSVPVVTVTLYILRLYVCLRFTLFTFYVTRC